MINQEEARSRWGGVQRMMAKHDLDLVLTIDWSRDEILPGHQRWLTGFIPVGGPAAVLLDRDGKIQLISQRVGKLVAAYYHSQELPVEIVDGFSASLVAERVSRIPVRRLGIAEAAGLPSKVVAALGKYRPAAELVDISMEFQRLRFQKSPYEIGLIRKSCEIADEVWERVPELLRVGRKNHEIIADIDHLVRLDGAEGGFHLLLPLPFLGRPMQSLAVIDKLENDSRYLLEVSPRYHGYYSQLTIPVTSYRNDRLAFAAYDDLVEAKREAQPHMTPGADLSEVARGVADFLERRGRKMTSLSLGHFCGLALEEPRHDPTHRFELEEGMTFIFHPVLADPQLLSLMRADTYLITKSGAERMNRYDGGVLSVC